MGINIKNVPEMTIKKYKKGYICWADPTKKSLERCRKNNSCNGAGVWAWHLKKKKAKILAMKTCNKEFGKCVFKYCEKRQ